LTVFFRRIVPVVVPPQMLFKIPKAFAPLRRRPATADNEEDHNYHTLSEFFRNLNSFFRNLLFGTRLQNH
jgi:hypothetical protein